LIGNNEECLQNADDLSGYSADDLKAIADVSRIALNANFMTRRLKANKVL
ncbi:helix-turn-helix protein, partial [human gut metagenome]